RVDPKIENKVKAKVEPKVEPKVEMKIEPKGVSKPDVVPVGELRQFVGHRGRVTGVAFSSDGSKVFTSCYDQTVRSWDAKTGKEVGRFEGVQTRVHSLAVSRDGSRIVAGTDGYVYKGLEQTAVIDSTMKLWDTKSGDLLCNVKQPASVDRVAISTDNQRV